MPFYIVFTHTHTHTHTLTHTHTHTHAHINTHDCFSFGVTVGVFGVVFLVRYAVSKAKPNKK